MNTLNYDNMPKNINGTISFVYDGNSNRVKKTTPTSTVTYIDNLEECVGGVCGKYILANGSRIALKSPVQTLYFQPDYLGSTTAVTDVYGNKVEDVTYTPYGTTNSDTGTVSVNHKFTDQELDNETGLYNYGARLYDPVLARFLTPDSIVPDPKNPQSFNRYSYVLNNPVNSVDPTGHESSTTVTISSSSDSSEDSSDGVDGPKLPIGTALKNFGNSLGKACNDIGSFFGGLFGSHHENPSYAAPQDQNNMGSRTNGTSMYSLANSYGGTPYTTSFGGPLLSYGFSGGGISVNGNMGQNNSSTYSKASSWWGLGNGIVGTCVIGGICLVDPEPFSKGGLAAAALTFSTSYTLAANTGNLAGNTYSSTGNFGTDMSRLLFPGNHSMQRGAAASGLAFDLFMGRASASIAQSAVGSLGSYTLFRAFVANPANLGPVVSTYQYVDVLKTWYDN